jgi:nicotinate-nucleotide adenylyltransferase
LKKIGILGGIFNPPHTAHLIAAEEVRTRLELDKIMFIPAANPPHKDAAGIVDADARVKMVTLAVAGNEYFEVSDIEIKLSGEGKSYTVNTLGALVEQYKNEQVKFYLIIGMDQLIALNSWKEPEKLFTLSEVVVINRPWYEKEKIQNQYSERVTYIKIPYVEISSSTIRNRVKENKSIKYLVPEAVEKFIIENNLYK